MLAHKCKKGYLALATTTMQRDTRAAWPYWAIYWTLGNFFKICGNNYFAKLPTFLGKFCKGVKIFNFSSEITFGQLL